MTKQITIRLNEEKFRPLLDILCKYGKNITRSDSELVAMVCFNLFWRVITRFPELNDKTLLEHELEARGITLDQQIIEMHSKFSEFLKNPLPSIEELGKSFYNTDSASIKK